MTAIGRLFLAGAGLLFGLTPATADRALNLSLTYDLDF